MLNNTRRPQYPCGARALHILHTPLVPSASTSSCCFSRENHPPASLSIFQRSEGLAQVAMKHPSPAEKLCGLIGAEQMLVSWFYPLLSTQEALHPTRTSHVPVSGKKAVRSAHAASFVPKTEREYQTYILKIYLSQHGNKDKRHYDLLCAANADFSSTIYQYDIILVSQ